MERVRGCRAASTGVKRPLDAGYGSFFGSLRSQNNSNPDSHLGKSPTSSQEAYLGQPRNDSSSAYLLASHTPARTSVDDSMMVFNTR